MLPQQPIPVPEDAVAAARALHEHLRARTGREYTVGVGLKRTAGEFSEQIALFVYVPEKKAAADVPEAELIPETFNSYPTDVIEANPTLIEDDKRYDPLTGGIQISRDQLPSDGVLAPAAGTLGAMVRNRLTGDLQGLTCAHVVDELGLDVYQPGLKSLPKPAADIIGTVDALVQQETPLKLDCATVAFNGSRGVGTDIVDIGPVAGVSTDPPSMGESVKKRGMRTLLTHGFVVGLIPSMTAPAFVAFQISGGVPLVSVFAGPGDSGSVVLNEDNQVIGLLYAVPSLDLDGGLSSGGLALLIYNVQEALGVDIAS